jgi:phenylacetate-CoA ligase
MASPQPVLPDYFAQGTWRPSLRAAEDRNCQGKQYNTAGWSLKGNLPMLLREAAYVLPSLARQYGGRPALRDLQLRALNRLLAHCRSNVPYYRDDPRYPDGPLRALDEVAGLPLLVKETVRERGEAFVADGTDPARCVVAHTSGTTGQRVRVLHDQASWDYMRAGNVRRFFSTGRYGPASRTTNLRFYAPPRRAFERLGLFRQQVVGSLQPVEEIKRQVLASRPNLLLGFPTNLRELLRALDSEELERLRRRLRLVMTDSELLTPGARRTLQDGFGVPVLDEYGSWEVPNIYYECRHHGRHLAEDRVLVEIVDDHGEPVPDGAEGWVVATHLRARAMPLLRYCLGDAGLIETGRCRCGRRFRTMRLTKGRQNDRVVLPSGRPLYSDAFFMIAERHPGVAECFVRQDRDGKVRVHVVPLDRAGNGAAVLEGVRERLLEAAGGPFPLEVLPAERVPLTAGGKGRFIESEYRPDPP